MFGSRRTSAFHGAVLVVSMRWADRLIGLLSTLVLARLLVPEDFGIIAMASLAIGLAEVLLDLGVNVALIQNRHPTHEHYDTAWTLRLAQLGLAALLVAGSATFIAQYFEDPRVTPVLHVMAVAMFLGGLENIGVITFQKEMRFGLDFRFSFSKRLIGLVITLTAAWFLRSYWALVIGSLGGRLAGVLLSYRLHPMRPRLSLRKLGEIFSVSQWTLVNSVGGYLNRSLHKITVGRIASSATMGGYALADDVSAMPSSELLAPLNRVLFPAFVEAKQNLSELKRLYLLAQSLQVLVAFPASVGLALVAHETVVVLLGQQWLLAVPFIQLLALASVVQAITTSGGYVMLTLGHFRKVALINWFQAAVFLSAAFICLPGAGAVTVAYLHLAAIVASTVVAGWWIIQTLPGLRVADISRSVARPILGTLAMASVLIVGGDLAELSAAWELTTKVALGALTYASVIMLMWWAGGMPEGAESYLLSKAKNAGRS